MFDLNISLKLGIPASFMVILIVATFFGLVDSSTITIIAVGVSAITIIILVFRYGLSPARVTFYLIAAAVAGTILSSVLQGVTNATIF